MEVMVYEKKLEKEEKPQENLEPSKFEEKPVENLEPIKFEEKPVKAPL